LLDFIREPVQVLVQPIEEILLGFVHREVSDQSGLSRVLPQAF
jgi:hypothetical protein